jgi:hypothetical protein
MHMVMFHGELLGAPRIFSEGKQISLEASSGLVQGSGGFSPCFDEVNKIQI